MSFRGVVRRAVALTAVVAALASACGGESVDDVVARAKDSDLSTTQRCLAMIDLARKGEEGVAPLHELTDDPDPRIARCAVKGIAEVEDPDAANALVPLLEDDDPRVVAAALQALGRIGAGGRIGDPSVGPAIERLALRRGATPAKDRSGREVRRAAVVALGRFGDPGARSTLVEVLSTDPANSRTAGVALARIFQEDVRPLLPLLDVRRDIALAFALVDVGQKGTEDALAAALKRYGGVELAEYYLNCGNRTLEKAAVAWADDHGRIVMPAPGSGGGQWGSGV